MITDPSRGSGALAVCLLLSLIPVTFGFGDEPAVPKLDGRDGRQLLLENFRPQPTIKVEEHKLERAKFPVVDVHTHFRIRTKHAPEFLDNFVWIMDRNNIAVCVSLDGQLGEAFDEHLKYLDKYRDRFVVFANIDWQGSGKAGDWASWDCQRPDFARRMVMALTEAKKKGAAGLKVFKSFGLEYRNPDGTFIAIDDPRFDPIWQACGELGLPVLMHVADPLPFFQPIDETNERWEELHRRPEWHFPADKFPKRDDLLAARNRLLAKHPKTIFIGAHLASSEEDLARLAEWLKQYPNLYVDFASRINELGRMPYTARKFLIAHADRVLFGTDGPWEEERVQLYWRLLETLDENFPYSEKPFPPQGFWRIYGVGLPDDVLRKIYYENATKIVPGVKEKWEKYRK